MTTLALLMNLLLQQIISSRILKIPLYFNISIASEKFSGNKCHLFVRIVRILD